MVVSIPPPTRGGAGGFSLIELPFIAAILAMIMGTLAVVSLSASRSFRSGATRNDLDVRAQKTMNRIVEELRTAGLDSLATFPRSPYWDDRIEVDQVDEVNAESGAITWMTTQFQLVPDSSDPGDGEDNNGNGLVDEGAVVMTRNAGTSKENSIVMTRWVREYLEGEVSNGEDDNGKGLIDERGLCFELDGSLLRIHLTLEAIDSERNLFTRTLQTSINLRN